MTKFSAIDSNGKTWTKPTRSRLYTHAVIIHVKGYQTTMGGQAVGPYAFANWYVSERAAHLVANRYRKSVSIERVEVVPVEQIGEQS